jgi:glycyl-tRNA synthetase beta chain
VVDLSLLMRQRMVSQFVEDGFPADLVQPVAGDAVGITRLHSDPVDARERLVLLHQLRRDQRLQAIQAVVQRAAKLAEKGDLGVDQLTPSGVVLSDLFESASEVSLLQSLKDLSPLAQSRNYTQLAEGLQGAAKALEAFFDGPQSVMVMADNLDVRRNRLNLLGVLKNQASVLAQFDCIQS